MTPKQTKLLELSDLQLISNLEALSVRENETTVDIIIHLAEVERRKLFLEAGFSSLFAYCVGKLRYSEPAANRRISSARAVVIFPELLPLLLAREISLSTLSIAAGLLSSENKQAVIDGIKGKSRREVEEFIAQYRPRKELREAIKPLVVHVATSPAPKLNRELFETQNLEKPQERVAFAGECAANKPENLPKATEQRYELRFSVGPKLMQKLEQAKNLLSSKFQAGVKLEHVLDEALEHLLNSRSPERREKRREKRQAKKAVPLATVRKKTKPSRHIPQEVKDKVYARDQGQCAFVSADGRRCQAKQHLQYHHIQAFGLQGKHELENLSLRCAAHNQYQAELDYGVEVMSYCKKSKVSLAA